MSKMIRRVAYVEIALTVIVAASLAMVSPQAASAHERRTIVDEYEFVDGFLDEPAFVGLKNGLDLAISQIDLMAVIRSQSNSLRRRFKLK